MPIFFGAMKGGSTSRASISTTCNSADGPCSARPRQAGGAARSLPALFRHHPSGQLKRRRQRFRYYEYALMIPKVTPAPIHLAFFFLPLLVAVLSLAYTAKSLRGMLLWIEVNSRQSRNSAIHQILCLPINVRCFPEFDLYLQESELRESRNWGIQFTILCSLVTSMPKVA